MKTRAAAARTGTRHRDELQGRSALETGDPVEEYSLAKPPPGARIAGLRKAAASCRACPLWKNATATVFGEGPQDARVVFIGEQPGDKEDREGHPFIGPAGRLLDKALEEAGVDRSMVYVTNAVKHFKWEPRGKRRMHHTPSARDIAACRPWLQAELRSIHPALIVTLGATAARSVFEVPIRVTQERGAFRDSPHGKTLITIHPSALLRKLPGFDFDAEFKKFVADLKKIPRVLAKSRPKNL